jgi:hypothetical protein
MTKPVPESSNGGGRMFPDGETFTTSPLLPTPRGQDEYERRNRKTMIRIRDEGGDMTLPTFAKVVVPTLEARISSSVDSPASQPAPQDGARARPTIAGSGPSSPELLASWDPDTSSWRTSQVSLLSTEDERFPRSWERWPTSGMTRHGSAYGPLTLERPTGDSVSSYLPTPDTLGDGYSTTPRKAANFETGHAVSLGQRMVNLATPTTGDTHPSYDKRISPGQKPRARPVPNLAAQVDELLPTPRTSDTNGTGRHGDGGMDLRTSLGELTDPRSQDGSEP